MAVQLPLSDWQWGHVLHRTVSGQSRSLPLALPWHWQPRHGDSPWWATAFKHCHGYT